MKMCKTTIKKIYLEGEIQSNKQDQIFFTCINVNYLPSYKLLNIKTAIFPVVLHIKSTDFVQGRGCWKVNNSLPSDKEYMYMYIQTTQTQIIDTKKPNILFLFVTLIKSNTMNGNKGKVYLFQHIKTKLNEEEKKLDDMMKKLRTKFSRVEQTNACWLISTQNLKS